MPLRNRPSWRGWPYWRTLLQVSQGIRRRILLWFLLASSLPLLVAVVFSLRTGFASMQESLGGYFSAVARQAAGRLDAVLTGENQWLNHVVLDNQMMEFLAEADARYGGLDEAAIAALLSPAPGGAGLPPGAGRISRRLAILAGSRRGTGSAITVTDRQGAVVAASHPAPSRHRREAEWFRLFQVMKSPGLYVGVEEREGGRLLIVAPVFSGLRRVGAVELSFDPSLFSDMVSELQLGETGWGLLTDAGDGTLFRHHAERVRPEADRHPRFSLPQGQDSGWLFHPQEDGGLWPGIAGFARVSGAAETRARFGLAPWYVLVSQDASETYATARGALLRAGLVGSLAILFLGAAALVVAHHIATPLLDLRQALAQFAGGRRRFAIRVDSGDEIQELAEAFQEMAAQVETFEDRLRAFADAVNHSVDAIMLSDPNNRIHFVNPAFERLTGYGAEDVAGRDPGLLASGETAPETYREVWQRLQQGEPWRGEMVNRRKDGALFVADMTISPIHGPGGRLLGYIGVQRDVTAARMAWESIRLAKENLEQEVAERTRQLAESEKLAAIGRMAAMIAHDLRNPLSAVKMNLQILHADREKSLDEREAAHFRIAGEQVGHMEEILSSLLAFARPDAPRKEWGEIPRLVDGALSMAGKRVQESRARIDREWQGYLPTVHGDPGQLRRLFLNLVVNALQACGGDEPHLRIAGILIGGEQGEWVRVTITDNGPGLDPEIAGQAFEPFVSGHAKGTGLGLAIVRRIAEGHGGRAFLESPPEGGVRAVVELPV